MTGYAKKLEALRKAVEDFEKVYPPADWRDPKTPDRIKLVMVKMAQFGVPFKDLSNIMIESCRALGDEFR